MTHMLEDHGVILHRKQRFNDLRTFELDPNEFGYLFLCINFDRGSTGKFEFCAMSDTPLQSIVEFEQVYYKKFNKSILGKWNKLNAGGCSSEPTFYLNPQ